MAHTRLRVLIVGAGTGGLCLAHGLRRAGIEVGSNPIHTPVLGRVVLAGMRTGMRLVNHLPPIKNRMTASQQTLRGHDRQDAHV